MVKVGSRESVSNEIGSSDLEIQILSYRKSLRFIGPQFLKTKIEPLTSVSPHLIATFRLQYKDDYEYEFSVLSTRFRFGGLKFSKCACSELKTRTSSRPRTPI